MNADVKMLFIMAKHATEKDLVELMESVIVKYKTNPSPESFKNILAISEIVVARSASEGESIDEVVKKFSNHKDAIEFYQRMKL